MREKGWVVLEKLNWRVLQNDGQTFAFCSCIAEAPTCILPQMHKQTGIKKAWVIIPRTYFSYFPTLYGRNQWRLTG